MRAEENRRPVGSCIGRNTDSHEALQAQGPGPAARGVPPGTGMCTCSLGTRLPGWPGVHALSSQSSTATQEATAGIWMHTRVCTVHSGAQALDQLTPYAGIFCRAATDTDTITAGLPGCTRNLTHRNHTRSTDTIMCLPHTLTQLLELRAPTSGSRSSLMRGVF